MFRRYLTPQGALVAVLLCGAAYRIFLLAHRLDWVVALLPADDYFYYLNIAHHLSQGHGSTFDGGVSATNGYHPLFAWILTVPFALGVSKAVMTYAGLALQAACSLAAAAMAWRIARRRSDPWLALLPSVTIALNYILIRYSLVGFETPLSLLTLLMAVDAADRRRPGAEVGLWLGLAGLARVDALVAVPGIAGLLLHQRRRRALIVALSIAVGVSMPWVIWSSARFGTPLPQSGTMKLRPAELAQLLAGLKTFCASLPAYLAGYDLLRTLSPRLSLGIGLATIACAALSLWPANVAARGRLGAASADQPERNGSRPGAGSGWLLLIAASYLGAYAMRTDSRAGMEFMRYLLPSVVLVEIGFCAFLARMTLALPARWGLGLRALVLGPVVACLVATGLPFLAWVKTIGPLDTYVGLCHRTVPAVLHGILRDHDRVGSFDAGSLGYSSPFPVVNLDGLVNGSIVTMLRDDGPGAPSWQARYLNYFKENGITVLVGGTAFSWVNIFPDWRQWRALHDPIRSEDGGEVVFLEIPRQTVDPSRAPADPR